VTITTEIIATLTSLSQPISSSPIRVR